MRLIGLRCFSGVFEIIPRRKKRKLFSLIFCTVICTIVEMESPTLSAKSDEFNYGIKSTIAQVVALFTSYLFNMKIGIDTMAPGIIIGAAIKQNYNSFNRLPELSDEQKSWIGSLVYLLPPVGSLVVPLLQDRFGHRKCMMLSNAVHILTAVVLLFANTANALFAVSALMGFNMGLVTSFAVSYSGEICDPKLRGTLNAVSNLFYFGGYMCVTTIYAITNDWKLSILLTVAVPTINSIVMFVTTPDSPMWLLSKGKAEKAKQTFSKIRGGASEEKCASEFQEMIRYVAETNPSNLRSEKLGIIASVKDSLNNFVEPEMLKPLQLMTVFIFFSNLMSGVPFTPYLIHVFDTFKVPIDSAWAMTMYTGFCVVGNVFAIVSINRLGKRFLALCTLAACSICYLSIGIIGTFWPVSPATSWTKLVLFYTSTFFSAMGIQPIVWILMCEVFPMKHKTVGAGLSSMAYYILGFLMTNFYLELEAITTFHYIFVLFGVAGFVGLVYLFVQLPETENKTLNEISEHFKSKRSGS